MGVLGGVGVRGPMTPPPPFLKIIQLFNIHVVSYQENRPPTWPKSYPSDPPPHPPGYNSGSRVHYKYFTINTAYLFFCKRTIVRIVCFQDCNVQRFK